MRIDSRYNWFMYGIVLSLITIHRTSFIMLSILIIVNVIIIFSSKKLLGAGDTESLGWIILGIGVLSIAWLFIFMLFFVFYLLFYVAMKKIYMIYDKTPGMIIVFGSFLTVTIIVI